MSEGAKAVERNLPGPDWRAAPGLGALALTLGIVAAATAIVFAFRLHLPPGSVPLLFLLAVVLASIWLGFWPGLAAALLAFLAVNFFFVEPYFTLRVENPADWLTLFVLLVIGALTGFLVGRLREEAHAARRRAHALDALHRFASVIAQAQARPDVVEAVVRHGAALAGDMAVCVLSAHDGFRPLAVAPATLDVTLEEQAAAERALRRGVREPAVAPGWSGSRFAFEPLSDDLVFGFSRIARANPETEAACESMLDQARLALQKLEKSREAEIAAAEAQREAVRAALLSSLSHDLRTPLSTILGGVSSLRELGHLMAPAAREDTLRAVEEEAERLSRYVGDLLHMTRLRTGLDPRLDWVEIADILRAATNRARRAWPACRLETTLPSALPLVRSDAVLLEQALFNLIDNAVKFSPAEATIRVFAEIAPEAREIILAVADHGPGIPAAEQPHVLAPFFRGAGVAQSGTGLGLAIVAGIVEVLGGRVTIESPTSEDAVGGRHGTTMRLHLAMAENRTENRPEIVT